MRPDRAAGIFISYRREDSRGVAGRLVDSLRAWFGDERVFRDVEGIEGGAAFDEVIESTLDAAGAVIVLIGPGWLDARDEQGRRRLEDPDDWVAREVAAALRAEVPVYPVLVDDAPMPRAEELPDGLKPLVRYNAVSVSDGRWRSDVERLARILAIDVPGSVAGRKLGRVRLVASLLLLAGLSATTASLVRNLYGSIREGRAIAHGNDVLSQGMSGLTFVAIMASSILLLVFARWIDESRRRYAYASGLVGILGTGLCYAIWKPVQSEYETIVNFLGSTVVAASMLVLMILSGFRPK